MRFGIVGLLLALVAPVAAGQVPDSAKAAIDSLTARVERAEEALAMLQQQLAAQSETAVSTRSGLKLEFTGRIL
ncbi:MAG: hypothetical protein H3C62_10025, partial [Gemmatimonadaceae bacterium]|nr:hypothetical protein [Gemmatimonadaceae bacterium]